MKLFIKNMLSLQSISEVKSVLQSMDLHPVTVALGEVELTEELSAYRFEETKKLLNNSGFDLVNDNEIILIEKVKNLVIEMIHYTEELPTTNYSDHISNKLKVNYTYLSKFFSKVRKITIEQFIILHKIERVKQLLLYNELTLSQIALKLNYSSTAHLSAQFKKVTGITPSIFKKLKYKELVALECL